MKVKLRDMTREQYVKFYNNKGFAHDKCRYCIFSNVACNCKNISCWVDHKDLYSDKFLDQEVEIENIILTDKEREFLQKYINIFPSEVVSIQRRNINCEPLSYLVIYYKDYKDCTYSEQLPCFKTDSMYKGMELDEEYALDELGLKQND